MLDRNHIETLLRIHGLSKNSSDEEIRSILTSARYHIDEIDGALALLRQDPATNRSRTDGLYKVFRSDDGLAPQEVSVLLGIDIDISNVEVRNHRDQRLTSGQHFIVLGIALCLAFSTVVYAMYKNETGPFHPAAQLTKR